MKCTTCGTELATANVLYDLRGNVTCGRCLLASETAAGHVRASMKVKSIAYGGPVLGIAGMFFNPFFIMSAAAIANGIYVLRSIRQPDTARHLEESLEKMKVAAIAGMVLGGITAVLGIMNMFSGD
jgi:hypothetical protein